MQIKNCIDFYLSEKPNLNLQYVSKKTSVPYSTLRRITLLEGNPKPEAVIKIYTSLGQDELLYKYMKEHHPELAKIMNSNFSHNKEYQFVDGKKKSFYVNEDYFLILNLVSTRAGTTEDEISYHMGLLGLERLKHLVEEGLVIEGKDGRYLGTNQNFKLSFADTKSRIGMALGYYRLDEAGSTHNWMSLQTESLNEEGLKALKLLNRKHFNDRKDQIYNNPMYNGDIKHYTASVSSTFLPYSEKGGLQ